MHARVVEAINKQINSELSASYSYLAMSAFCERLKFTGAARWLRLQSQEEYMHAMKLFDFVLARDENVDLVAIERPRIAFNTVADVFIAALEQEQEVSRQIDSFVRDRLCGKGVRRRRGTAVVPHRAGGRRKDGPRDRRQVQDGRQRSGVAARPRPGARRPLDRRRGSGQRVRSEVESIV